MLITFLRRAVLAIGASGAVAMPRSPLAAQDAVPAPEITGVVRDSAGVPLPNAQVFILGLNRGAVTDAAGRYVLRRLPPGTYQVDVMLIGYAHEHRTVTVSADRVVATADFELSPTPLRLGGVVTTATPVGADALDIAQSTVSLSGADLARNIGAGVAQTLENQPGLATRYSGPLAAMPVIRGLTGDRILVLQNGERTGDLASSAADHAVSVDPLSAERIEVVRGPASLLYGSSALGGVVNVITNDIPTTVPSRVNGHAALQGTTANPGGAVSGGATVPLGESAAIRASGSFRDFDDVRVGGGGTLDNTDARSFSGVLGLGTVTDRVTAGISAEIYDFVYGLPSEDPDDPEAGIRLDGDRRQLTGRASVIRDDPRLSFIELDATAQWYQHSEIEPGGEIGTRFDLKTQTASLLGRTAFGRVSGAVGVQGFFKQYAPVGEEAFTPSADHSNLGLFLFEDIPFGNLADTARAVHLQLGARYDYYRVAAGDMPDSFGPGRTVTLNNFSGSVGLTVPIRRNVAFNLNAARAFRAPTVEELFADGFHAAVGTYDVGDPTLDPETNNGLEAVFRAETGRTHAQLAAYVNRIDGYIVPVVTGTTDHEGEIVPLVEIRQRDAQLAGVEGQVEVELVPHLVAGVMGDLVRGEFASDDTPLPFIPPARVGGSLRWDDTRFSLSAAARHAFEQDRVTGDEVDIPTAAYTLVDVSAGVQLILAGRLHSLTLRADNLLDEEYRDATSRIKRFALNPGRNLALVYRVLF